MMRIKFLNNILCVLIFLLGSFLLGAEANFSGSTDSASEAVGGSLTINFDSGAYGTLTYTVGVGTATNFGSGTFDFNLNSNTIPLISGETTTSIDLNVTNDNRYEANETVIVTLSESSGNITIGSTDNITFTITNDDAPPTVKFETSTTSEIEGDAKTIRVEVDASGTDVGLTSTIDWTITNGTTSNSDHISDLSGTLSFSEGDPFKSISYDASDDAMDENDETFTIALSNNVNFGLGSITTHTHTILDNDEAPNVGFTEATTTKGESDGTITVTLDLDAASGKTTTANVGIGVISTATATEDYSSLSATTTLTYSANDQSESFSFDLEDDELDEDSPETLVLYIAGTSELNINSVYDTLTISITDNDIEPTVSISAAGTGAESVTNPDITVSLDAVSGRIVTVNYADDATGTALAGTDYTTFAAQSLTIPAGSSTNTFQLSLSDDSIDEVDETVIFSISLPDGSNAILGTAQQTYTIADDDDAPFCGFSTGTSSVTEGNANSIHTLTVVLLDGDGNSITSGKDITFNYAASADGTAAGSGTDYTFASGEVTISAGASSTDLSVTIIGDVLYENNETIIIELDPDGGGITNATDGTTSHTITINEDDSAPKIQFNSSTLSGDEGSTETVTIEIDAVSTIDATVSYSTSDGTATGSGTDYTTLTSQTATISAGQTTTTFSLVTAADALDEDDETITVSLSGPTNSSLNTNSVLTHTITDDDPKPTISFSSNAYSNSESTTSPSLTINLSAASGRDLVLGYAVSGGTATGSGTDFSFTDNAAFTVVAGNTSETVSFTVIDDALDELNQTIIIDLTAVTNVDAGASNQQTTYTITDDDNQPAVEFSSATATATESDATKSVTLSISAVSEKDVKVTLTDGGTGTATATDDYTVTLEEKTISAGTSTLSFDVTLVDDAEDENAETIILGLTGNTNAGWGDNTTQTITLADSDPIPSVYFTDADGAVTVQEIDGSYSISVSLNYKSYQDVIVAYAVSASSSAVGSGTDYTMADGLLTISAGNTTGTIDFGITDDGNDEYGEEVIIDLTANTNCTVGATGQLTITITDDDSAPTVRFSASADAAGSEGDATQSVQVEINIASGKDVVIPYTIDAAKSTTTNSGSSADHDLADGNFTISAGNTTGNITFDISDDAFYENTENLVIDLGTPADGSDGVATGTLHATASFVEHTFVITSNDNAPSVEFQSATASVNESSDFNNTVGTFTLQLSAVSEVDAKVYIDDGNSGTASDGNVDYQLGSTEITIPAGNTTTTFSLVIVADNTDEDDETFTIKLSNPVTDVSLGGQQTQIVTIIDDDDPPTISIDTTNSSTNISESIGTASFKFLLDLASEKNVSIDYAVNTSASTAATLNQDYTGLAASGTVTMLAGTTDTTFTVTILSDLVDEENQTITLDLSSGTESNVSLSADLNSHIMKILDDDDGPAIYFVTSASSASEGNTGTTTPVAFTITLTDSSEQTVAIPYTISATGSHPATLATDYTSATSTVTVSPGSGLKTIDIPMSILGDNIDEYNQTITIGLGPTSDDITNGSLHATNSTTYVYTITDDDAAPIASISGSGNDWEMNSQTLTVTLDSESEKNTSFNWTVTDVTTTSTVDYTIPTDALQILAGVTTGTNTVTGISDLTYEGDETFTVAIAADSNATLGTSSLTVTLLDDDTKSKCSFEGTGISFLESAGTVKIPFALDKVSGFETVVTYAYTDVSTTDDLDYGIVLGTITIPAGSTLDSISISITDDNLVEDTESIEFEITNVGANTDLGAFATTYLYITDNDNPPADFTVGGVTTVYAADATKVVKEYWNSFNESFTVNVPIDLTESNSELNNGSVQLIAKTIGDAAYTTLGNPVTIDWATMKGDSLSFTITETIFEGHGDYAEDSLIMISARITDQYSNVTDGTQSIDTLKIDTSPTTKLTVNSVTTVGGTVVSGYWNGTNTSTSINVPLANDASLIGGSIQLKGKVTAGNAFASVGTAYTITGADVNGTATVTAPVADYIALGGFADNLSIYHTALVIDAAGNEKTFNTSTSTVLIDTTRPVFQTATSSLSNGYYNTGDNIPFSVVFDDTISSTDAGTAWLVNMNSGNTITGTTAIGNIANIDFTTYTVETSDASADFGLNSVVISNGFFRDKAGNDMDTFTITSGNNISDSKDIYIDGNAPIVNTLTSITTLGDSIRAGYWNSTQTSATVPVGLANDTTLIGGTIQLLSIIGTVTSNIGTAYTILASDVNDSVTMAPTATDIENATGFAENKRIYFSSRLTDISSNATDGEAPYFASLSIDQSPPPDKGIDTVYSNGGYEVPGYINSTNNRFVVKTGLAKTDSTLKDGTVQLQVRFETETEFSNLMTATTITSLNDITEDSSIVTNVDTASISVLSGATTGDKLYFRSILTDIAGNSTVQAESDQIIIWDLVSHESVALTYSPVVANKDSAVTITATFSEAAYGYTNMATDTLPHIRIEYPSGLDNVNIAMDSTAGTNRLIWTYTADMPDNATDTGSVLIWVSGSDIAGNPIDTSSITGKTGLVIDNESPTITYTYSNTTTTNTPPLLGKGGDVITLTANWNENADMSNIPKLVATYADASVDTQSFVSTGSNANWIYSFILPTETASDGNIVFSSTSSDSAKNSEFIYVNDSTFRVDNTPPLISGISPASSAHVKSGGMLLGYTITEVGPTLETTTLTFNKVSGPGSTFNVSLDSSEMVTGIHIADSLLAQVALDAGLSDSTVYNLVFTSSDSAGNDGADSVTNVKYDISPPKASISFGREYISGGMLDTATVVFSEKMIPTPTINLFFGQDSISGQMDLSQASDSIWTFEFIAPDGINNNGMVTARFSTSTAVDYAGNNLGGSDSIAYPDTLYIENIVPQATFTYANKSDTTLSNIGIGEQNILITVKMNELISMTTPVPSIDYWYANGVASIGDTVQTVLADSSVGDTAFYFNIVLADGETNDGPFHTTFTAKDRPGNVVESFVSTDLFQVDNIHPADFLTGTVNINGKNPVQGWLNGITDSIEVKLPISAPSSDSTLYQGGRVDIQLYNITNGTQWKTIVLNNTVENDSITTPGDSVKFYRSFANILEKFPNGIDLYLGDSLKVRGKITDRNGNSTFGTESTYKYVYDPTPPIVGTATGGNFITLDTLISSDLLSIQWSEFTDFGDAEFHSGTERYEYAIEKIVSPADSINNFYNWDTVPLPNEPYELTFFLKHDETYVAHIRAFDVAGNISDTLHADTLVRYNSNPVIAPVLAVSLSEDIPWNNLDSVIVSDLDLATMQSDSFRYRIITTRTIGNAATSNVATIDSIGRMSWVPTQDDTGFYNMKVIVEDNYLLIDSVVFALSVAAVNDTPVVNIVAPDHIKEWIEDAVDTTKINLTSYLIDVDNNDSTEMSWAAIILDTTQLDEDYPLGQVIVGPGTPWNVHAKLAREYLGFNPNRTERKAGPALSKRTVNSINNSRSNSLMSVKIDTASSGENWAYFTSAPNYYGTNHRVIFIVHDIEGAEARDTVIAIVNPKNDPPVISEIPLIEVIENDSIKIDFGAFTYDVDDTSLTFTISAITNEDKITISPMTFLSNNVGDSVQFIPSKLWSADATIQVIAADEEASDTATFTLDVLRVLRPHPSVAVVQNNAFSKFIQVIVTDTVSKTTNISMEIQNEDIDIDTIAAYTWSGDFNFDVSGTYSIDVHAIAHVGDTLISEAFSLAAAKTSSRWSGRSGDGRFSVVGDPGAVAYDQPFLIVDSSLFSPNFNDQASYVLGDEGFQFVKPIEIRFGRDREDLAIYRRKNGVIWEELPSITKDENIFTLSEKTGYFKLGPKTIIVPEETNIHQNYPNPFNPITTIIYDIGLMDGLSQNVSINIYNLLGQHVKTLVENKDQIGQFRIQWNGQNKRGEAMSSGIYFVQLSTNTGVVKNKKMMLLK